MNFFDYLKNKLFPTDKPIGKNQPYMHEMLKRKEKELKDYHEWKSSEGSRELLQFIRVQYELSKQDMEDQGMMRVLSSASSYGFMLRFPDGINPVEFQFLFDLLRDKFLTVGYKIYASDVKHFEKEAHIEQVQRHYLKPNYKNLQPPLNQLFGNITIELFKVNDSPTHIKFLCNNYSDAKYSDPLSYDELMEVLFNQG